MGNLFASFNTGVSGLHSAQSSLYTTAHNLAMRRQKGIRDNRLSLPMPFIRPDTELMQTGFRSEKVPISRRSVR